MHTVLSVGSGGKGSTCCAGGLGLIPGLERSPGEGNCNLVQFLTRKSHGQKSLVGYSPWGCKELDRTKRRIHTPTTVLNRKPQANQHPPPRKDLLKPEMK